MHLLDQAINRYGRIGRQCLITRSIRDSPARLCGHTPEGAGERASFGPGIPDDLAAVSHVICRMNLGTEKYGGYLLRKVMRQERLLRESLA